MTTIRVFIADDHAVLRAGIRMLLEAQRDMQVVGEAADGLDAMQRGSMLRADVCILDLSMPGPPSGSVIRAIRQASPQTRVLVLTMHDDEAYIRSALAAGATGFLVKRAADTELLSAIRAVHAGRTFVDVTAREPRTQSAETNRAAGKTIPPKRLSRREREVLRFLAQGYSNQQIADATHVSVKTVETYRARLREKLGLKGRAQLYRFAAESGLLDPESAAPPSRRRRR